MADNKKYIGEGKLPQEPNKKLTLKLKDGSVTTDKLADGAVFPRMLASDDCQQDFSKLFYPQKTGQPLVDAAEEYMAEVRRRAERRHQHSYQGLDLLLGLTGRINDREVNLPCLDMFRPLTYGNRAARGGNLHSGGTDPTGLMQMARMHILDFVTPSKYIGLIDSDNSYGFLHLFDDNNRGLFSNR